MIGGGGAQPQYQLIDPDAYRDRPNRYGPLTPVQRVRWLSRHAAARKLRPRLLRRKP